MWFVCINTSMVEVVLQACRYYSTFIYTVILKIAIDALSKQLKKRVLFKLQVISFR